MRGQQNVKIQDTCLRLVYKTVRWLKAWFVYIIPASTGVRVLMCVTACHALQRAQPRLFVGRDRQQTITLFSVSHSLGRLLKHGCVWCLCHCLSLLQTWLHNHYVFIFDNLRPTSRYLIPRLLCCRTVTCSVSSKCRLFLFPDLIMYNSELPKWH